MQKEIIHTYKFKFFNMTSGKSEKLMGSGFNRLAYIFGAIHSFICFQIKIKVKHDALLIQLNGFCSNFLFY
jgi:hypothetical protein